MNLHNLRLSNSFLDMAPKAQATQLKIGKLTSLKSQAFVLQRAPSKM